MRRKYPWEEWFALGTFTLVGGVHYHCSQSTMAQTVRNNASSRGLRVRLDDTGTSIVVRVIARRNGTHEVLHTDKAPVTS